ALALPRQVDDGRGAQRLRDDRAGILRRSGVRARRWGDGKARERETSAEVGPALRLSRGLRRAARARRAGAARTHHVPGWRDRDERRAGPESPSLRSARPPSRPPGERAGGYLLRGGLARGQGL